MLTCAARSVHVMSRTVEGRARLALHNSTKEAAVQLTREGFLGLDGSCVVPTASILDAESRRFNRQDAAWLSIWLVFLAGPAPLPPRLEWHQQVHLLAIANLHALDSK